MLEVLNLPTFELEIRNNRAYRTWSAVHGVSDHNCPFPAAKAATFCLVQCSAFPAFFRVYSDTLFPEKAARLRFRAQSVIAGRRSLPTENPVSKSPYANGARGGPSSASTHPIQETKRFWACLVQLRSFWCQPAPVLLIALSQTLVILALTYYGSWNLPMTHFDASTLQNSTQLQADRIETQSFRFLSVRRNFPAAQSYHES